MYSKSSKDRLIISWLNVNATCSTIGLDFNVYNYVHILSKLKP